MLILKLRKIRLPDECEVTFSSQSFRFLPRNLGAVSEKQGKDSTKI